VYVVAVWILATRVSLADEAALQKLVERSDLIVQAAVKLSGENEDAGIRWKLVGTVFGTLKREGDARGPDTIEFEHFQKITEAPESLREPLPFPVDREGQYILFLVRGEKGELQFANRWFGALPAAKGTAAKVFELAGKRTSEK
jgi:hypothetical protein